MMETAQVIQVKNSGTPDQTRETIFNEVRQDFADWMAVNVDEVWRPRLTLTKEDNEFAARAFVPGINANEIEVMIAPEVLMIKGRTRRGRKLMTSIKFPKPVDTETVRTELREGLLGVWAEIAGASNAEVFMPRAA